MIVGAWSIKIIIVLTIGSIIILSCKRVRLYSNINISKDVGREWNISTDLLVVMIP